MIYITVPPLIVSHGDPLLELQGPAGAAIVGFGQRELGPHGEQAFVNASTFRRTSDPTEPTMFWGWLPTPAEAMLVAIDACRHGSVACDTLDNAMGR